TEIQYVENFDDGSSQKFVTGTDEHDATKISDKLTYKTPDGGGTLVTDVANMKNGTSELVEFAAGGALPAGESQRVTYFQNANLTGQKIESIDIFADNSKTEVFFGPLVAKGTESLREDIDPQGRIKSKSIQLSNGRIESDSYMYDSAGHLSR